jgi:hypothetical protein
MQYIAIVSYHGVASIEAFIKHRSIEDGLKLIIHFIDLMKLV